MRFNLSVGVDPLISPKCWPDTREWLLANGAVRPYECQPDIIWGAVGDIAALPGSPTRTGGTGAYVLYENVAETFGPLTKAPFRAIRLGVNEDVPMDILPGNIYRSVASPCAYFKGI
jgi:hypothetical protein